MNDKGSTAMAEEKCQEGPVVDNGGGVGEEKRAGRGLALLGDLPSLGKKVVSQKRVWPSPYAWPLSGERDTL